MKINSKIDEKKQKIFYGQVPMRLLRDPAIWPQAKALYGLIHTYCQNKDLFSKPRTMISQKTLARALGFSTVTIREWLRVLKDHSWISTKRKGRCLPNEYTLLIKRDLSIQNLKQRYTEKRQRQEPEADESENG